MGSRTHENGRLARTDYSVTYRENEKLDEDLDEQLISLNRSAQRVLTEKDGELEEAKANADKIFRLKEAIKNRPDGEEALAIVCSQPLYRRPSTSSSIKRKISSGTVSTINRRESVMSSVRDSLEERDERDEKSGIGDNSVLLNGDLPDMTKMSLTERRLAMERDQYSAKNLFNVRRRNISSVYIMDTMAKQPDSAREGHKQSMGNINAAKASSSNQTRPMTSPAAYGRMRTGRQGRNGSSNARPKTASAAKLVKFADKCNVSETDSYYYRAHRRARSRRELQKLSQLKIDPFADEAPERPSSWSSCGDRQQDMLLSLKAGHAQLQARVSAFLKTMEDFNKRGQKTGLEQILEAT